MMFQEIKETLNGTLRRRTKSHVTIGTTIGLLVGAAAGILLAPKSGRQIRKDIKTVATKGTENVSEAAHKIVESAKKQAAAVKMKTNDIRKYFKHSEECYEENEYPVEESKFF